MRVLIIIAIYLLVVVFLLLYFNHKIAIKNKEILSVDPGNSDGMEKQAEKLYEHRKKVNNDITYLEPRKGFVKK